MKPDLPGLVPEFLVTDFARSLAFWRDLIGFQVLYERAEELYQPAPDLTRVLRYWLKSESMRRTEEFADVGEDQASG